LILFCVFGSLFANFLPSSHLFIITFLSFSAVISAAILISWAAESYQFIVSQGLAIAIIAVLQVLPEFFVEAAIAWEKNIDLMMANFTGSNRLLMGLGWVMIYFVAEFNNYRKHNKFLGSIVLRKEHSIEIIALLLASFYYLFIVFKATLTVYDAFVLGSFFVLYMIVLSKLPPEAEEHKDDLLLPAKAIVEIKRKNLRVFVIFSIFVLAGFTFIFVVHPFLHSMQQISVLLGIPVFIFVQWLAPFLSEFPEKLSAFYWARTVRLAPMALLNMVSSNVNQWTLLVAMIPIVYSLSMAKVSVIPLDLLHREEIFLSTMMMFYGCACLAKLRFTTFEAIIMFSLWFIQFLFSNTRLTISFMFVFFALSTLVYHRREINLFRSFKETVEILKARK
jgi:cation:H+ antiporter